MRPRRQVELAPEHQAQLVRLVWFREAHPEVVIGPGGFGTIEARIPAPDGETVVVRHTLRELLDKLDELLP